MGRVKDKVSIVTGGSLGIGRSACELLAREGAKVAITDIKEEEGRELEKKLKDEDRAAKFWKLDVSKEDEIKNVFKEIADEFGSIDCLVNNAGISGVDKPTDQISEEDWDKVMAVNVKGVFLCTKHAIPYMREQKGGSIINLSSIYGIISAPDIPPYHASKGAVRLMTKTDALLYAENNIRVNSVHPGFIWTPLVSDYLKEQGDVEEGRKNLDKLHPIGHVGEPDDIGNAIVFLASEESKFMTGSEMVIDGGYTCK